MRILLCPLAAAAFLALAACGSKTDTVKAVSPDTAKPVEVLTASAVSRVVPADFEETGTFVADESSDIAPLVAGRVIATPVDVGDRVRQGQIVCELDHRDAQLKLDQARAQIARQQRRLAHGQRQHRQDEVREARTRKP